MFLLEFWRFRFIRPVFAHTHSFLFIFLTSLSRAARQVLACCRHGVNILIGCSYSGQTICHTYKSALGALSVRISAGPEQRIQLSALPPMHLRRL
ncbi:hypothetical protein B0H19DRAFT_1160064 [Mycena capillaripes]|nr:hypothetical protein B0H19DRAFT_1160933 [Mycena capillaripes]KAJ6549941.1 hypothetical protein B0H19DRAFT_1160064 [Mycena capillaripes]